MNQAEYWILRKAINHNQCFREVAYECGLSHQEVLVAATRLFQSGDIMAKVWDGSVPFEDIPYLTLTTSEIKAHLDGKLKISYALTLEGGARWEIAAHVDWNRYFQWYHSNYPNADGEYEWELIGADSELMQWLLGNACYLHDCTYIPGTQVWDAIELWEATYWKTLPKVYRVRYRARETFDPLGANQSEEWLETQKQIEEWYSKICRWYADPEFESEEAEDLNPDYSVVSSESTSEKVEYLILSSAITYETSLAAVALDCHLSHAETQAAGHSLFQKGDILGIICQGRDRVSDVVMTPSEIQAELDGKLLAYYYLTPKGAARWEAIARPNWNLFYQYHSYPDRKAEGIPQYKCEIISTQRQLTEKLLSLSIYLFEIPISGTEVWDIIEPWQPNYWKTLPRAYRVRYQGTVNRDRFLKTKTSPEWSSAMKEAYEWLSEIQKWYSDPQFDHPMET